MYIYIYCRVYLWYHIKNFHYLIHFNFLNWKDSLKRHLHCLAWHMTKNPEICSKILLRRSITVEKDLVMHQELSWKLHQEITVAEATVPRCSRKNLFLQKLAKFTWKICARISFWWSSRTPSNRFIKRDSCTRVFLWILQKLKNTFLKEQLWTTALQQEQ